MNRLKPLSCKDVHAAVQSFNRLVVTKSGAYRGTFCRVSRSAYGRDCICFGRVGLPDLHLFGVREWFLQGDHEVICPECEVRIDLSYGFNYNAPYASYHFLPSDLIRIRDQEGKIDLLSLTENSSSDLCREIREMLHASFCIADLNRNDIGDLFAVSTPAGFALALCGTDAKDVLAVSPVSYPSDHFCL